MSVHKTNYYIYLAQTGRKQPGLWMKLQLFFTLQVKLKIYSKSVTWGRIPVEVASIPSAS